MGGLLPVVPIQLPVYLWAVWKETKEHVSNHTWMKQHVFKKKKLMCSDKSVKQKC